MALAGVYKLTDPITGVFYIGSTGNLDKRFVQHKSNFKHKKHHNVRAQIHNDSNLDVKWVMDVVVLVDDRETAYVVEQEIIDQYIDDPLMLNVNIRAKGAQLRPDSPEERLRIERMTMTNVARLEAMTPEERVAVWGRKGELNGMYGKTHTDEARKRISDASKGNRYALGAIRSAEVRATLSAHAKLRTGEKNSFYGKRHTEATKHHMSAVKKANPQLPGNARQIEVDGKVYESLMAAKRATGISQALLIYRIKSDKPKYSGYRYV